LLYGLAAFADTAFRLNEDRLAGQDWASPAVLVVAVNAGLFWPADLAARLLLGR
jgi:hypothetical protein